MARIRTIKPSFWEWMSASGLTWDARLLAIGLMSGADDEGRFVATHASVCGYVFPHEEVAQSKFKRLMAELVGSGFIALYDIGNKKYGHLPKWHRHQKINRPQKSMLPQPPQDALFGGDFQ